MTKWLVVVVTVCRLAVVVYAACIFRVGVLVDGLTSVLLGEQFLNFPGVWLDTHREFQVFLGNRVPELKLCQQMTLNVFYFSESYLVDHHHGKQIAESCEEKTIQIVLHVVADGVTERVEQGLSDNEDQQTKGNVSQRPAIIQGVGDKQ